MMPRNLNDRVELMVPIEDFEIKLRIKDMILSELKDNQKSYTMNSDGSWSKNISENNKYSAQKYFQKLSEERVNSQKMTLRQKFEPYKPIIRYWF